MVQNSEQSYIALFSRRIGIYGTIINNVRMPILIPNSIEDSATLLGMARS